MMLIDDAFASIGSANSNRRGYYSDGECNIFALRETRDRRRQLDPRPAHRACGPSISACPPEYAAVALRDPAARSGAVRPASSPSGNRFTPSTRSPYATDLSLATEFTDIDVARWAG